MQIVIAALAAALLSALGLLPPDTLPAAVSSLRNVLLVALSFFIAWKGLSTARHAGQPAERPVAEPARPVPPAPKAEPIQTGEALVLLSLLQEKGRFLDYVMEDITAFKDAQVAAASRVVHQGCAAVIREYLAISPAHAGKEGERITIDPSADPNSYRLLGKVQQVPPYSGVVVHRGWKTTKLALPRHTRQIDPNGENVIAPIEVEIK